VDTEPEFPSDPHDIRLTTVTLENPYLISEIDNLNVSSRTNSDSPRCDP
jgi:hypothetical protein